MTIWLVVVVKIYINLSLCLQSSEGREEEKYVKSR